MLYIFFSFSKVHTDLTVLFVYYISTWSASNYKVDGNLNLECKILADRL